VVIEMDKVEKYARENRRRLERLAEHGNGVIQAMALAVLRVGGERDEK